jgi:hypothetical protein
MLLIVDYQSIIQFIIIFQQFTLGKMEIRWENGLGGLGGSERIFLFFLLETRTFGSKKIRSYLPDPPNPFSHSISIFQSRKKLLIIFWVLYPNSRPIKNSFVARCRERIFSRRNHDIIASSPARQTIM